MKAELRLLASKLKMRECEWVDHQSIRGTAKTELSQAGPIDLALDAWKLAATASKWAETDLRTPASQELSLLWIVPRLYNIIVVNIYVVVMTIIIITIMMDYPQVERHPAALCRSDLLPFPSNRCSKRTQVSLEVGTQVGSNTLPSLESSALPAQALRLLSSL